MYKIRITYAYGTSVLHPEKVIHDPENDIWVHSAKLTIALNDAGSLSFETDITHEHASWIRENVMRFGWLVVVEDDDDVVWMGRIASVSTNRITGIISVECEGLLATLNDGVIDPYAFSGTPSELLETLLVDAGNSYDYEIGTVTVTDPNDYILRSNDDYTCAWDEIRDKTFGSSLGGYMFASWNTTTRKITVDWLEESGESGTQVIEYAENLLDLNDTTDGTDFYTGIMPYGVIKDESTTPPTYVTLKELSDQTIDGVDIIGNLGWAVLHSLYTTNGCLIKPVHFENVSTVTGLKNAAVKYVKANLEMQKSVTIKAIDLSNVDPTTQRLTVGNLYNIVAPDTTMQLTLVKASLDLLHPESDDYEFGKPDRQTISSDTGSGNSGGGGGSASDISSAGVWYGTCDTAANETVKEIECLDYVPQVGSIMGIKFTNGNSYRGTIWLKINDRPNVALYVGNMTIPSGSPILFERTTTVFAMYDGLHFQLIGMPVYNVGYSYEGAPSWFGTCNIAAHLSNKTCTCEYFRPGKGAVLNMKCTAANTLQDKLTLNVNSTGALDIYTADGITSSSNPLLWNAGDILTLVYVTEPVIGSHWYYLGKTGDQGGGTGSVTGVKGNAESTYRTGNVNLTPANIGAANATHTHSASDITSGLATVATSGSYNDLSNKPTLPTVGNTTVFYGTCATAASTQAKAVTCADFAASDLAAGTVIYVKMTNNQTYNGAPTLNVNSTGAVAIKYQGTTNAVRYEWRAGEVICFIHDGTNWIIADDGRANTSYYGVTKLSTSATSTSTDLAAAPSAINSLVQNMIEPYAVYSSSSTYAVGDRVRYNYQVWECTTAITTEESWNAAHWTALLTVQEQLDAKPDTTDLATVATTGAYSDLSGKPTIPSASSANPQMDGTASAGTSANYARADHVHPTDTSRAAAVHTHVASDITSGLATVATSGSYNDLSDKPTIPAAPVAMTTQEIYDAVDAGWV